MCVGNDYKDSDNVIEMSKFKRWRNTDVEDINLLKMSGVASMSGNYAPYGYFEQDHKKLFSRLESGYLYVGSPVQKVRPLTEKELEFLPYSAQHYVRVSANYIKTLQNQVD